MNYLSQSWLINRRHALRAMGTCIALPMLECMTPLKAAEKVSTPKRSAFIYLANGVHSLNYQITESGRTTTFPVPSSHWKNTAMPLLLSVVFTTRAVLAITTTALMSF